MRPKWCLRILMNLMAIVGGVTFACILYFKVSASDVDNHSTENEKSAIEKLVRNQQATHPRNTPSLTHTNGTTFIEFKNNSEYRFKVDDTFTPSTCPSSMQHKMLNNTWAKHFFRPQIQKFMHRGIFNRHEFDRLMPYSMPFGYKYTKDNVTYEELHGVLDNFGENTSIFNFSTKSRPECISCAVVGNGGILNGSKMGKEIDSHDMVFRVNHCIRRGHEEDVGTRTTHYVFMDRSLVHTQKEDIPRDEGIRYIFLPCRKADYKYIQATVGKPNPKQKFQTNAKNVRILHPDFVRYSHKIWESTRSFRPTTGGMMLFTALHACDSVSVYGMGFTWQYTEHYYDNKFLRFRNVKGSHDFKKEIAIMKQLDEDGVIKWYKRDVKEWMR
ncbi:alpha-N-acetylgalactosaminide alpha-2,6-sialyltransferase 1-like [Amphiura filiformis]|uniref:alpha-N-acetylgalactosaminide alpha-2,6-sialyltransferase 1-like n=1 Tax=Amphiura filiformis TaxID=82378 RepID=UPI003B226DAB